MDDALTRLVMKKPPLLAGAFFCAASWRGDILLANPILNGFTFLQIGESGYLIFVGDMQDLNHAIFGLETAR